MWGLKEWRKERIGKGGRKEIFIQFDLFPAHINISYNKDNVYMCRKRDGQKTVLMNVRPLTITSKSMNIIIIDYNSSKGLNKHLVITN